jgi:hypothetical protein
MTARQYQRVRRCGSHAEAAARLATTTKRRQASLQHDGTTPARSERLAQHMSTASALRQVEESFQVRRLCEQKVAAALVYSVHLVAQCVPAQGHNGCQSGQPEVHAAEVPVWSTRGDQHVVVQPDGGAHPRP